MQGTTNRNDAAKAVSPNTGKFAIISYWFCSNVPKTMFNFLWLIHVYIFSGMSHLTIIPDTVPPFETEQIVCTSKNQMEEKIKGMLYKPNTSTCK